MCRAHGGVITTYSDVCMIVDACSVADASGRLIVLMFKGFK